MPYHFFLCLLLLIFSQTALADTAKLPAFQDIFIPLACEAEVAAFLSTQALPKSDVTDRYGEALITDLPLQQELVARGLAVSYPSNLDQLDHAAALLEAENNARLENRGCLWQSSGSIKSADAIKQTGKFMIFDGEIYNVFQSRNNIFLNFDRNWKTDTTIRIEKSNKHFKGMDLENLAGKKVRARGFVSFYNGPSITLPHPVFLELLD